MSQINLFDHPADRNLGELIPLGEKCSLKLFSRWLDSPESDQVFDVLLGSAPWESPSVLIGGRYIQIPRLQAWYGDESAVLKYSGLTAQPYPWNSMLSKLKIDIEEAAGCSFNSVLVNCYRDGSDSVGWHADDELELGDSPVIASLSLGQERSFCMKKKEGVGVNLRLPLKHGDLLIMQGETQKQWLHAVPKVSGIIGKRINLTFRYVHAI